MNDSILMLQARVSADGTCSVWLMSKPESDYETMKLAMEQVRAELDRILREGPTKCPFAPTSERRASDPERL